MRLGILAALTATLVIFAAPAQAATDGDAYVETCIAGKATVGCTPDDFVRAPFASALSPDGTHLYVGVVGDGAKLGDGIVQFDVDPATGQVSRHAGIAGCITSNGSPSEPGNPGTQRCLLEPDLGQLAQLLIVGSNLYVATGNAVLTFDISSTGELTRKPGALGCVRNGAATASCASGNQLGTVSALATNADATALYVRTGGGLAVFTRATDGTLVQKNTTAGCLQEYATANCTDAAGLDSSGVISRQLHVAGNTLYVPNSTAYCFYYCDFSGGVGVFDIQPDGTLAQAVGTAGGCITSDGTSGQGPVECVDGHDALRDASAITGRGDDVYVGTTSGLLHYKRNAQGLLTGTDGQVNGGHVTCFTVASIPSCTQAVGFRSPQWMAISPSGTELIGTNQTDSGIWFMRRELATGAITPRPNPRDCLSRTGTSGACTIIGTLSAPATFVVSSDSEYIYMTGHGDWTMHVLQRDFAPVCQSKTVAVPHNTSVSVPLTCSDANGDPVTLEIASDRHPTSGQLAMIDQAKDAVRYNPFLGFSGTDSFGYRAVAGEMTSAVADVTLQVAGPPPASTPTPPPVPTATPTGPARLIPTQFSASWSARRVTQVRRFRLSAVPAGSTVAFRCSGGRAKGCRTIRTIRVSKAAATLDLRPRLRTLKLRPGARLEVRVTAPGFIGKVRRYSIRRGRKPSVASLCLAPGSATPVRSCPAA